MTNDRFTVISSDCHAGLPPDRYRDYVDPEHREVFDMALPMQKAVTDKFEHMFLVKEANEKWRSGVEAQLSGAWNYERRLEVLDGDGIAGEIVFPDGITEQNAPPFGAGLALPTEGIMPDLQWAGARAHNRWLAELCARDPVRHFGVAVCPLLWDIDRAVEEVRFGAENGLGGMLIPLLLTDEFEPYHHPRYNPFWAACEDLGIVVCFHSGPGPFSHFFGKGFPDNDQSQYPGALGVYISEVFFWTWRPLIFMLWGGVFERYSRLRASVTETGQGWLLPPIFRMLDHHYNDTFFSAKLGDYRSHLSMAPTDYFRRNCAIGASCMPRSDAEMRHQLGMKQIMWGTDYPHPEGTWPHTRPQMIDTFKGLPEDDIAAMLGGNAAEFYGFDRAELDKVGARVGPRRSSFSGGEPVP
ncbi:MAG: amidohydrolase family protein [Gammaproteobacteria bacterium]|nr:amidohydrolase family protein [Gammaproteobacteria bacterium]